MSQTVKGFFRRQTQKVREKGSEAVVTVDPVFDENAAGVPLISNAATRMASHTRDVITHITGLTAAIGALAEDFTELTIMPSPGEASASGEPSPAQCLAAESNIAALLSAMHSTLNDLMPTITTVLEKSCEGPLVATAARAAPVMELRKKREEVRLELDFFRRKVNELEQTHATDSDKTRLPRNTVLRDRWQSDFDAANDAAISQSIAYRAQRDVVAAGVAGNLKWALAAFARASALKAQPFYGGAPPATTPPPAGSFEPAAVAAAKAAADAFSRSQSTGDSAGVNASSPTVAASASSASSGTTGVSGNVTAQAATSDGLDLGFRATSGGAPPERAKIMPPPAAAPPAPAGIGGNVPAGQDNLGDFLE
eukprot:TRINITY_DN4771_c0_g1_i1.p2 TRINITY_DN4771_c0_g1~~TRINITY_DN4771_c0_g1_i1.p2  ORF type:complete len:368 (-),score=32.85 TRINITY_DN4771_c0_g1_i1:3031-4134(-)